MRKRFLVFLIFITFLATVLRFYRLGKIPISLEWDEVAIGYDAYSILKTGRDQFGKFLPLTFRSLDDWKPPLYEYLTVPSVALFGLTEFATRLPSAVFGILTVIFTFWLTNLILSKTRLSQAEIIFVSLLASFFLAISPWHLQFSRAAFEVNISVFVMIVAIACFLAGLNKPKFFIISSILFGLSLFSYHSTRVVSPLLMMLLFVINNRSLPDKRYIATFFSIFGIFFLLFLSILTSPQAHIRFKATNIFDAGARYLDEKDLQKEFLTMRLKDQEAGFELAGKIFHNQRFIYLDYETLKKAFFNYLSNFGFEYLFIKGDKPLHHAPGFGLVYIWDLPFMLIGLVYILIKGLNRNTAVLLFWILIVPIPNAVTREAPHAVRTELILPSLQIIGALGISRVFNFIQKESRWVSTVLLIIITGFLIINKSFYLHQYYVHTNNELSKNWMYGRKEAVEATEQLKNNYDKVLVSLRVDMPHIFWLFYTKYPPEKYLLEGGTISGGFEEKNYFDKYEFRFFNYLSEPPNDKILMVGIPDDFPPDAKVLKTIYYLDGSEAIKIVENRP